MTSASLKYTDRTDRAFGLCGMALSLFIFDAEQYIDSLQLDAPADLGMKLTTDFFQPSNPGFSVKDVWKSSFRHFQLTSAMIIGNLLARSLNRRHSDLSHEVRSLMLRHLTSEGEETCGLESGEVEQICDNAFTYIRQLLLHPAVNNAVCAMVKSLTDRNAMSREEILTHLLPLGRL